MNDEALNRLALKHAEESAKEYGYVGEYLKAFIQGCHDEKIIITKNLLKTGLSIDQISQVTDLSSDEIQSLMTEK